MQSFPSHRLSLICSPQLQSHAHTAPYFCPRHSTHHVPTFVPAPADLLSTAARCLFLGNVDIVHLSRVTAVSGVREEHVKNHMTKRFTCDGKDPRWLFWRRRRADRRGKTHNNATFRLSQETLKQTLSDTQETLQRSMKKKFMSS